MVYQLDTNSIISNMTSSKMEVEDNQTLANRKIKEKLYQIEVVQETKVKESSATNLSQQHATTEKLEDDLLFTDSDSLLERSIWVPNKDSCEGKGMTKAKVVAIKVLRNNVKHREKSLR